MRPTIRKANGLTPNILEDIHKGKSLKGGWKSPVPICSCSKNNPENKNKKMQQRIKLERFRTFSNKKKRKELINKKILA
jgi:hypothetical protein